MNRLLMVCLFICALSTVHSQSMYVKSKSGGETSIELRSIRHLLFDSGTMIVKSKDMTQQSFELQGIMRMTFALLTRVQDVELTSSGFRLFPNPVANSLNVDFLITDGSSLVLEILSLEGKLCYTRHFNNSVDKQLSVDVSGLQKGLYIVRMIEDRKITTEKFIKN
jgi:hypothetical protein